MQRFARLKEQQTDTQANNLAAHYFCPTELKAHPTRTSGLGDPSIKKLNLNNNNELFN